MLTGKFLAMAAMSGIMCSAAMAQNTYISGPRGTVVITRSVPTAPTFYKELRSDAEIAAREQAWEARCKPTLSAPNELGVRHYLYAAPGCQYGD